MACASAFKGAESHPAAGLACTRRPTGGTCHLLFKQRINIFHLGVRNGYLTPHTPVPTAQALGF